MNNDTRPIGVFDSGVGGISVLAELSRLMPNENFIYYGDSLNAPYGTKSHDKVRELTTHTADWLMSQDCKCLVIACNTATSAAVRPLRAKYPRIPIIGIEPALKPAVLASVGGHVLVLATNVTLHEEKFITLLHNYESLAHISTLAAPGIVEFVESGIVSGPRLTDYLRNELLKDYILAPPDAVVLGCTHYPFVKDAIKQILGENTVTYDGGNGTAREARRQLAVRETLAPADAIGTIKFYNSLEQNIELEKKLYDIVR